MTQIDLTFLANLDAAIAARSARFDSWNGTVRGRVLGFLTEVAHGIEATTLGKNMGCMAIEVSLTQTVLKFGALPVQLAGHRVIESGAQLSFELDSSGMIRAVGYGFSLEEKRSPKSYEREIFAHIEPNDVDDEMLQKILARFGAFMLKTHSSYVSEPRGFTA